MYSRQDLLLRQPKMDVDEEEFEQPTSSSSRGERKRFEVKKVKF